MELTSELKQYWLDVLAELCRRELGVQITMTLKSEDEMAARDTKTKN